MRQVTKENETLWEEVEVLVKDKGYIIEDVLEVYAMELDECGDEFIDCFRYSDERYTYVCETPQDSIERRMYDIEFEEFYHDYYDSLDSKITLAIPEDTWLIIYMKDVPTIIGRCDVYHERITYQENLSELD